MWARFPSLTATVALLFAFSSISLLLKSAQDGQDFGRLLRPPPYYAFEETTPDDDDVVLPDDDSESAQRRAMAENEAAEAYFRELTSGRQARQKEMGRKKHGAEKRPKIWASIGLCFNKNTRLHGKRDYPYSAVLPLSVLLWKHFFPEAGVLVQVAYEGGEGETEGSRELRRGYEETLRRAGAEVAWAEVRKNSSVGCVQKSQLVRLFAFAHPSVSGGDVVVTADANAFVVSRSALAPVLELPWLRAWVMQYHDTAHHRGGHGETFNQNFVAMRAADWQRVLGAKEGEALEDWLARAEASLKLREEAEESGQPREMQGWYYDQWITTLSLVRSGMCTVPEYSALWTHPAMEGAERKEEDIDTCFHGYGFKDCNSQIHVVFGGCKWWHFFPQDTLEQHIEKFHEVTDHEYTFNFVDPFKQKEDVH